MLRAEAVGTQRPVRLRDPPFPVAHFPRTAARCASRFTPSHLSSSRKANPTVLPMMVMTLDASGLAPATARRLFDLLHLFRRIFLHLGDFLLRLCPVRRESEIITRRTRSAGRQRAWCPGGREIGGSSPGQNRKQGQIRQHTIYLPFSTAPHTKNKNNQPPAWTWIHQRRLWNMNKSDY